LVVCEKKKEFWEEERGKRNSEKEKHPDLNKILFFIFSQTIILINKVISPYLFDYKKNYHFLK